MQGRNMRRIQGLRQIISRPKQSRARKQAGKLILFTRYMPCANAFLYSKFEISPQSHDIQLDPP